MVNRTRAFKAGRHQAFEEIYKSYYKKVFLFLKKHVNSSSQAEDLLHDVFVRLWEQRLKIKEEAPLEAQIYVIARNLIIDKYRREARRQQVYNEVIRTHLTPDSPEKLDESTLRELQSAIEALPPRRREIFRLSKMDGLTYQEIADSLKVSKSTVESQMVKALKFLRDRMSYLPFF